MQWECWCAGSRANRQRARLCLWSCSHMPPARQQVCVGGTVLPQVRVSPPAQKT